MNSKDRDLFRLEHISECIRKITTIVDKIGEFEVFQQRWIEQDAMIRNFEILGEAANHISDETKSNHPGIECFKIRGMRNFMTHEYFGINIQTIWNTAIQDIPKLDNQIQEVIKQFQK